MKAKIFIMTLLVMILSAVQGYAQRENRGNTRSRARVERPQRSTVRPSRTPAPRRSPAITKPQGTVIPVRAQYGTAAGNAPAFCRNVTEGTDRDNIPPFGYAAGEARNSTAPSGIVFTKSRYFIQTPTGSVACSSAPSSACTAPRSYASAAASSVASGFRASSRLFAPSPSLLFQ